MKSAVNILEGNPRTLLIKGYGEFTKGEKLLPTDVYFTKNEYSSKINMDN